MVDVNLNNIKSVLRLGFIHLNIVYPITSKSHFRLLNDVSVRLSNDATIVIPKDFQFDGSSSPRFLWWLFPSYGDFFFAALIHDYMYQTNYMANDLGSEYAREFADKEMRTWSILLNDRNIGKQIDNHSRYYAVRLFGKKVYNKNK
jgi:hypothetical protein